MSKTVSSRHLGSALAGSGAGTSRVAHLHRDGVTSTSKTNMRNAASGGLLSNTTRKLRGSVPMGTLFTILMALGCMDSPTEPHNAPTSTGSNTPGQVIDLVVTDSTSTAVTLSFTQVDDGTGNPAAYAVRSHVGPMNWGAAEEASEGTCAAPLQGTGIGSTMSCTIEGLLPDVTYTFQVAAFRGTFQAGAVYGELSNVVPDMEEPPNAGDRVASTLFNVLPDGTTGMDVGFAERHTIGNLSIVSDGGSNVLRTTFPEGHKAGTGGVNMDFWDGSNTQYREVYHSMDIRLVSGPGDGLYEFYSGTNKLGFWGTQGVGTDLSVNCYPDGVNRGTGQLEDDCRLNWVQENNTNRFVSTGQNIQVGTWYHWDFQFILNNPANNTGGPDPHNIRGDGIFRWWMDGVLISERTDVAFITETADGFFQYRWNPTWGGGTGHDDKKRTDYVDVDNLYISGVPK